MHKLTQEALTSVGETLARWSADIVRADRYMVAIEANLPEKDEETSSYHSFGTNYGDLQLDLYQAEKVAEIGPYMRAVRYAGFKRKSKSEDAASGTVTWEYEAEENGDTVSIRVRLHLTMGPAAACRYVETGKREVPVMELLCGEELDAWNAAHAEEATA